MAKILSETCDDIAIVTLNNGVINSLDEGLVDELLAHLAMLRSSAKAMILRGGEKFFSMGLDLPQLMDLDRPTMAKLWRKFNQAVMELYTLPIPTVAELAGHAVAGGNIFALTCDYRLGVEDRRKIGLNEVLLGIPVPHLVSMMLEQVVGARIARDMMYTGKFLRFSEAMDVGLIDALHPAEKLADASLHLAKELARVPAQAFAATKANRVAGIVRCFEQKRVAQDEVFLDCWFCPGTQSLLKQAAERF